MNLLALDTSNRSLTVASASDHHLIAQVSYENQHSHSVTLMPAIDQVVQQAGWQPQDLDRIIVAQGPGSYTGLRIGVTTAKMLAWTLHKELVGVSSLAVLAQNVGPTKGYLVPLFDARNHNVFAGVYRFNEQEQLETVVEDQHLALATLLQELHQIDQPLCFIYDLRADFQEQIKNILGTQVRFIDCYQPQPESLITLGLQAAVITDLNQFVPHYLRQTQAELIWSQTHSVNSSSNYVEDV